MTETTEIPSLDREANAKLADDVLDMCHESDVPRHDVAMICLVVASISFELAPFHRDVDEFVEAAEKADMSVPNDYWRDENR